MYKTKPGLRRFHGGNFWLYAVATLIGFAVVIPFFWMISTSLKENGALMTVPIEWIPSEPTLDNYRELFRMDNFYGAILNSFYLSVVSTAIQLLCASMAAYALTLISFKGRQVLFRLFLVTLMIPSQVTFIPLFIIMSRLGLNDSLNGLVLLQLFNAFALFMMRQSMLSVNTSLIEAAVIDGAKPFTVYLRVVMPVIKGTVSTLAVISFMGIWNDFLIPLVMLSSPDKYTLPLVLNMLNGQHATEYNLLMAGCIISIVPILIVYFAAQKNFQSGMQVGLGK